MKGERIIINIFQEIDDRKPAIRVEAPQKEPGDTTWETRYTEITNEVWNELKNYVRDWSESESHLDICAHSTEILGILGLRYTGKRHQIREDA